VEERETAEQQVLHLLPNTLQVAKLNLNLLILHFPLSLHMLPLELGNSSIDQIKIRASQKNSENYNG